MKKENRGNLFFTCAVALQDVPPWIIKHDPPAAHNIDEAILKMDRFCHRIYKVPITWLCHYNVLEKHGETLARYIRDYGDEVAILEHGILTRSFLRGEEERYQGWVEASGLSRPDDFVSKEPELVSTRGFHDMSYEELVVALSYLKSCFDERLGQDTRILANPFMSAAAGRVMSRVGLNVSWAHNWNYFCEGINNKGSLFYPFYMDPDNHNVPTDAPLADSVLAVHWGPISPVVMHHVETHSRLGIPGYCLNALEMTNRSEGLDVYDFHRKVIEEYASWSQWNPYIHIPLQLEGFWMDESPMPEETYDQFPRFNSSNTETFYTQIEAALRVGAQPLSISAFAEWHRENVADTAEMIWVSEDHLPQVRGKGKDRAYSPMVLLGNKTHQYWFDQARGFNYVRKYCYANPVPENEIVDEYPFAVEPQVTLQIKRGHNARSGISLTPNGAVFELSEFDLSSQRDESDYACVLWKANVPPYIHESDIKFGGAIKSFRLIREKNMAILFADLKRGLNEMSFSSPLPSQYIRIVSTELIGKRVEIWIQNDSEPVELHALRALLPPSLKIGGFWWDGRYSRTIFRYGWGFYDRETGDFELKAFYPLSLTLNKGLTRCSVEIL